MRIGVPFETATGEKRVSATPNTVRRLKKRGFDVAIASGAGQQASFSNQAYQEAGADIWEADQIWSESDIVLKVTPPGKEQVEQMQDGSVLMGFLWPKENEELVETLRSKGVTSIAMECVPRISRAQKLDALSSMSNVSGYRAVIEAAYYYGSFFNAQFTAAGRVDQAKVLIIGTGVAGLAAAGAARGLGAKVYAFDVRSAAREQVESMGAEFVEVEFEESGDGEGGYAKVMSDEFIAAEMALFRKLAAEMDIVITTALIPGRPAPKLWLNEALAEMKPGSVVVDLASERGGNCESTVPGETVEVDGVHIVGWTDMPSRLAPTSSQLYGMNLVHYLKDIESGSGEVDFNLKDVVVRSSIITHKKEVLWPPPPLSELDPSSLPKEMQKAKDTTEATPVSSTSTKAAPVVTTVPKTLQKSEEPRSKGLSNKQMTWLGIAILWGLLLVTSSKIPPGESTIIFLNHLTVFALSCFIGWQVIWNVTHALHTPLMSVTNAISGIILVGGMLQAHGTSGSAASILGAFAVLLAMINVVGGFAVTQRMLKMFRK
jgi:H+-translocating NAD(P) transhydrogenase subunit alpha